MCFATIVIAYYLIKIFWFCFRTTSFPGDLFDIGKAAKKIYQKGKKPWERGWFSDSDQYYIRVVWNIFYIIHLLVMWSVWRAKIVKIFQLLCFHKIFKFFAFVILFVLSFDRCNTYKCEVSTLFSIFTFVTWLLQGAQIVKIQLIWKVIVLLLLSLYTWKLYNVHLYSNEFLLKWMKH